MTLELTVDCHGSKVKAQWDRLRVFDTEVGNMFLTLAKTSSEATVLNVVEKEKTRGRPTALNTVELMRAASSGLGQLMPGEP